jgi:hypothetical protein
MARERPAGVPRDFEASDAPLRRRRRFNGGRMDGAIVSAMAGVFGSLVGGSASVATAWVTHKATAKREMLHEEIRQREALYGRFIRECSKLIVDSFTHNLDKPETFLGVYQLLSRVRLSASDAVFAAADDVVKQITEQYFAPNMSPDDLRVLVRDGRGDPMASFAHVCRVELGALRGAM